jgi:chromate transporter
VRAVTETAAPVSFAEALRVWARVAALSFGGPAGQIAVMHRILVDEKRWVEERRFLHALSFCTLLPGPEAQQLATYLGWSLHGTRGGLAAGTLFVLPGFAAILALSLVYAEFGELPAVAALFFGIKAAVLALVLEAALRIGRRVLAGRLQRITAGLAFGALFLFAVPFPVVVFAAGGFGILASRLRPELFAAIPVEPFAAPERGSAGIARALRLLAVFMPLWLGPTALCALLLGPSDVFTRLGLFFSETAIVTFGGAYAVLAYVAQRAVETYGWLSAREMLDGLGLAETTPGPLIMVVQFVGFLAAYRHADVSSPVLAGILGSLLTTWVTFVPSFLWIFLGAPYVEWLRREPRLAAALQLIMAAVVGVIANLAVWFALHVLFARVDVLQAAGLRVSVPDWTSLDPAALALSLGACLALLRFHVGLAATLGGSALAGLAIRW